MGSSTRLRWGGGEGEEMGNDVLLGYTETEEMGNGYGKEMGNGALLGYRGD